MSSLFKGIAEHAGNHRSVYSPQRSTINNLFLAQVLDVVTGEQIQDYIASGQATTDGLNMTELYKFVGAVRIKIQEYDSNRYENETFRFAFPVDRGNYRLPIPGELVLVVKASIMIEGAGYKEYFYTNIVGGANKSTRHAVRPNAVTSNTEIERPDTPAGGGLLGGLGQILNQPDTDAAAKRFEPKYLHDPSTILETSFSIPAMREGDHIIEGRFGGTIRFTGTLTQKGAWPDTPYVKHMLKGSKDGDPMVLVKIPPPPSADSDSPVLREAFASTPEKVDDNINDDLSSIYLNSSQNVPIQLKTSKKLFTWAYDIETEPDTLFGKKVDLESTILQPLFSETFNPNDVLTVTVNSALNFANTATGTANTNTSATPTGNVATTGEYQAVLIAGLDGDGYKPLEEQVALLQTSFSGKIKGFRYNTPDSEILAFLKEVPKIHVFMFSAGCRKAAVIAKSPDVILDKIYIIEPYAVNGNSAVVEAVGKGVPARHVFVGSSTATGKNVVPGAVSSNASSHWGALAKGGQFIGT